METNTNEITIVSGLPRSGTSMMMRMLQAGGMPLLVDGDRSADHSNPKGYFEYAPVKRIKTDAAWIPEARGKALKVVAPLVCHLPPDQHYAIVILRRSLDEILASQETMLGGASPGEQTQLRRHYREALNDTAGWLGTQPGLRVYYQDYRRAVQEPLRTAEAIADFLGRSLDIRAMAATIDPALYRQRTPGGLSPFAL